MRAARSLLYDPKKPEEPGWERNGKDAYVWRRGGLLGGRWSLPSWQKRLRVFLRTPKK
jgi:hypothetical protein